MADTPPALSLLDQSILDRVANTGEDELLDQDLLETLETITSSLSCVNGSLLTKDHYCCKSTNNGVDFDAWRAAFRILTSSSHESVTCAQL